MILEFNFDISIWFITKLFDLLILIGNTNDWLFWFKRIEDEFDDVSDFDDDNSDLNLTLEANGRLTILWPETIANQSGFNPIGLKFLVLIKYSRNVPFSDDWDSNFAADADVDDSSDDDSDDAVDDNEDDEMIDVFIIDENRRKKKKRLEKWNKFKRSMEIIYGFFSVFFFLVKALHRSRSSLHNWYDYQCLLELLLPRE